MNRAYEVISNSCRCRCYKYQDCTCVIGKLYKCIRCPSAYHTGDMCIAAGSRYVAGHHIVCSDHFKRDKKNITHSHINTNWCFVCSLGKSHINSWHTGKENRLLAFGRRAVQMSDLRAVSQSLVMDWLHFSFSEQTIIFLLCIQLIFATIKI